MSYNGGKRGDIGRGAVGAGGEIRQSVHGPSAGKAIAAGFALIYSLPSLAIFYLIFMLFFSMLTYQAYYHPGYFYLKIIAKSASLILMLIGLFVTAGIMHCIKLIFRGSEWSSTSFFYGGKRYFKRFLLTTLIYAIIAGVISLILFLLIFLLFRSDLNQEGIKSVFSMQIFIVSSVLSLYMTFSCSYILVEDLRSRAAISNSIRLIADNKRIAFHIWFIICLPMQAISWAATYYFPASCPVFLIKSAIFAYLNLILMATVLYFVLELKKGREQLCEGVTTG